jgi:nicotinate-nucleotide adenylyltransferase
VTTGPASTPGQAPGGPRALGILGGTFDPIHLGHLALAHEARRSLDLERVLFVPNADPPHKDETVTAPVHRAAMVRLALAGEPNFELSPLELDRPGPSYAVDTVAAIAARSEAEGRPEPWFILSDEAFADLPTWREPRRILELARVAVAPRPGAPRLDRSWTAERFPGLESRVVLLQGPRVDIAATDVRARIAQGRSIVGLVPDVVADYIAQHGLYRGEAPAAPAVASSGMGTP